MLRDTVQVIDLGEPVGMRPVFARKRQLAPARAALDRSLHSRKANERTKLSADR